MIDLAQLDNTLRKQNKQSKHYYVVMIDGTINGSFDDHAKAIRFLINNFDKASHITTI